MSVPAEIESLIADAPVSAHLATAVDDRPHVAPVWYGYRDGTLYLMTGGRKLANVRENPRVAVSIEAARDGDVAWNVTLLGTATVSDDPDRIEWASGWIYDRYEDAADAADADESTGSRADGGEADEGERAYALVEIEVGSASWTTYE
ncbi:MAG: pyridoxamine 5'-phosphate oxidase family protein [Haloferacaceae archaeon]